jgi:glycosyltransferase involved in cell wall biosynthesis
VRQLPVLLEKYKPHVIFICHDEWFFSVHANAILQYKDRFPTLNVRIVLYCPIESPEDNTASFARLAGADVVVCYTGFGQRAVEGAFDRLASCGKLPKRPAVTVMPHGMDKAIFYPLCGAPDVNSVRCNRSTARERIFPGQPQLRDAFIVLNANRNTARKRIDLTLEAFAAFAADKADEVYLYLHMGTKDKGIDILQYAAELGIERRLLTTTRSPEKPDVPDEHLNLIYNACDVGLNTSSSEGWGLVSFEHAATVAAQIVPNHSACAELWQHAGLLVPTVVAPGNDLLDGAVSIERTAETLDGLYGDRDYLLGNSLHAFEFATSSQLQWATIARDWRLLFLGLCDTGDSPQ